MQLLKSNEKDECIKDLNIIKLWFEEDGFNSDLDIIEEKISLINNNLYNQRRLKYNNYINAVDNFFKEMNNTYHKIFSLASKRPWTQKYFSDNVDIKYSQTLMWYDEIKVKQDQLMFYEVILI